MEGIPPTAPRDRLALARYWARRRIDRLIAACQIGDHISGGEPDEDVVLKTGADNNEQRLHRIEAVTDAALSGYALEDLLPELLDRIRDLLDADTATALLVDPTRTELVVAAATGSEEEVWRGVRIPIEAGFAGQVAARGEPIAIEHVDASNVIHPILLTEHIESMLGAPMIAGGRLVGVLHVGTKGPRRFTENDVELLRLVADRLSLSTQAQLSQLDRATTLALQRSLLPARPQAVDGLDVAARYVPGTAYGVGGDWYDLFTLPSGHIGVTIGDVAGKGLRAAVIMGRIRSALRAYALESADPADVLTRLDRKIQLFEPDAMATAIYAVIDPDRGGVTLSSAGHLPPVAVNSDDAARRVDVRPDLPLGAYPNTRRHNTQTPLNPHDCMLLYTDGLVERRDRPIEVGINLLLDAMVSDSAEAICAKTMVALTRDQVGNDDIAMLALRRIN